MKTMKITNSDGFEMTVQVDGDDDALSHKKAPPAKKAAEQPANKAHVAANKAK